MSTLRLALVQMSICDDKLANINKAISLIEKAKNKGAELIVLPECFNFPYGADKFLEYAEFIPSGETSQALSNAAKKNEIFVIGGTILEKDEDKFYNTCTVWNREGDIITKFRKIHLFEMYTESFSYSDINTISPGSELGIVEIKNFKIGIGVCHDLRFEEIARIYRNRGCNMLIYPATFHTESGRMHWQLLGRSRANDTQSYVACVSPANVPHHSLKIWGHTQLIGPCADVLAELDTEEDMIIEDIDLRVVDEVRARIPTLDDQNRVALHDVVWNDKNINKPIN